MSHTRILTKMNEKVKDASHLSKEERSKRGEVFLINALMILNKTFLIDDLLKQNPNLTKFQQHLLADNTRVKDDYSYDGKSNLEVLIEQAKWLLNAAVEHGNNDASNLLRTLNTPTIFQQEETVELNDKIEFIDNYFDPCLKKDIACNI